jgi:outer membrane protein assembly factor BamB
MAQTAMFPRLQLAAIFLAIFSWIAPVQAQITVDWVRNYGTAGNNAGFDAVASDSSGNTYAAGHMRGATLAIGGTTLTRIGTRDAVVAKFDSTGSVIWAKNLGGAGASVFAFAVAVDGSGNVYVAGRLNQDLTTPSLTRIGSTDAFVIKLDSSGTTVWARNYGGSGATAEAYGLAVDSSGNVVAVGILQTGNLTTPSLTLIGSRDAFAIKLDSSGSVVWAQNFGGAGAAFDAKAVAADASGNVYLTGGIVAGNLTSPTLSRVGTGDAVVIKRQCVCDGDRCR